MPAKQVGDLFIDLLHPDGAIIDHIDCREDGEDTAKEHGKNGEHQARDDHRQDAEDLMLCRPDAARQKFKEPDLTESGDTRREQIDDDGEDRKNGKMPQGR